MKNKTPAGRNPHKGSHEMLCGIHPVHEALKAGKRRFSQIMIAKGRTTGRVAPICRLAEKNRIPINFSDNEVLDEMSRGVKHQGVVADVTAYPLQKAESLLKRGKLDQSTQSTRPPLGSPSDSVDNRFFLILEGVEDPHNLGAIIRTALCSGVERIFIPKDRAVHPSPSVSRVSAGAMEHADISVITNTSTFIRGLKKTGVWIAGLDAHGTTSLYETDFVGPIALVVGGEHSGIRPLVRKECDFLVSLPMVSGVTSLNASVACGIAMYEVLRQRRVAPEQ